MTKRPGRLAARERRLRALDRRRADIARYKTPGFEPEARFPGESRDPAGMARAAALDVAALETKL